MTKHDVKAVIPHNVMLLVVANIWDLLRSWDELYNSLIQGPGIRVSWTKLSETSIRLSSLYDPSTAICSAKEHSRNCLD
jgi:hypothetical protein